MMVTVELGKVDFDSHTGHKCHSSTQPNHDPGRPSHYVRLITWINVLDHLQTCNTNGRQLQLRTRKPHVLDHPKHVWHLQESTTVYSVVLRMFHPTTRYFVLFLIIWGLSLICKIYFQSFNVWGANPHYVDLDDDQPWHGRQLQLRCSLSPVLRESGGHQNWFGQRSPDINTHMAPLSHVLDHPNHLSTPSNTLQASSRVFPSLRYV
jgi:hypothetical protein